MNKNPRSNIVQFALVAVMTLALCGRCTPLAGGELETFVRDMLLNAAAAFLL